ncbi:hypothetical protein NG799_21215 [Laspinema sp. D1]|uniref:Transposase n=1 Tax=Laspinema palackyanum D2a TaxID=2953684 RepID=A0ABT2MVQ5_9CYAN|nr:hypothetical protein [Laspinema sp. D2a]
MQKGPESGAGVAHPGDRLVFNTLQAELDIRQCWGLDIINPKRAIATGELPHPLT